MTQPFTVRHEVAPRQRVSDEPGTARAAPQPGQQQGPARCYLVDPSPAYRSGLAAALRRQQLLVFELDVRDRLPVAPDCGAAAVAVVAMDRLLCLPEQVRGGYHATVALLARDVPPDYAVALRAGWTGVVCRDAPLPVIVQVVQQSLVRRVVLPLSVAQEMARGVREDIWPGLAPEQLDWLRFLAAGGTVAGLAAAFCYSEREMHRRLRKCYEQLGVGGKTAALLEASRLALI